jgi:dynein light chain roadblock-type
LKSFRIFFPGNGKKTNNIFFLSLSLKFYFQSNEIDETINRISCHEGVFGFMLFNYDGVAIKTNLDDRETTMYASLILQVVSAARFVIRKIGENRLDLLRIRSKRYEIIISPEKDYVMVVLHRQVN